MKILVSSCLLGENCKYSGGNNLSLNLLNILKKYNVEIINVCPEVLGGLPTPRKCCEIIKDRVFNTSGEDVTYNFKKGAEITLKIANKNKVDFCILKSNSPSCSNSKIYDGNFSHKLIDGLGITAKLLIKNNFIVFSEEEIFEIEKFICK